jgi:hypothetical protein
MSESLTWKYLRPEQVYRCLTAPDAHALRDAISSVDTANGTLLIAVDLKDEQKKILLDMYCHLLRFSKTMDLTPEKVSTLIGIVATLHRDSMQKKLSITESYRLLETLMVSHSVHRPPYSAQIFSVEDVKAITDYVLGSYFRHYKLYLYTFTPREVGRVRTYSMNELNRVPPTTLPPMSSSITLEKWEAQLAEAARLEQERLQRLAEERRAAEAAAAAAAHAESHPQMTSGLREQLDLIRTMVARHSAEKLDELEAKLVAIENKVAEGNKPTSAAAKGPLKKK